MLSLFPQASLARQTRMAWYEAQPLDGGGVVEMIVTDGLGSQASIAVGVPNGGVVVQSETVLAGQLMVGEVLSSTVIV